MAIHSIFAYPWNSLTIDLSFNSLVLDQTAISKEVIISAARNIILATKYIDIEASLPGWLLVYYPLVGCMNVFIHVLDQPSLPSVQSDMNLMEMVVGHFGHLGFISAETTFSLPRQMVNLAAAVVKEARQHTATPLSLDLDIFMIEPNFFSDVDFPMSLGDIASATM